MVDNSNLTPSRFLRWDDVQQEHYLALPSRADIWLTLWRKTDDHALVELCNSPPVVQYSYNKPRPRIEQTNILCRDLSHHTPGKSHIQGFPFQAIRNPAGKVVGMIRLNPKINGKPCTLGELAAIPLPQQTWYMAYDLLPEYGGKGLMTEVVNTVLQQWVKPYMGISIVLAFAERRNTASRRVLEKNGFEMTHEVDEQWPGNVAQLGLAIARTFDPIGVRTYGFQKPDQQALTSVLSFLIGASLGRFGDKIGAKHRSWLVLATFIQALLAMAGALCAHYSHESSYAVGRPEPSWRTATGMAALGFISASLGLQGIIGKRVGSPLNTTIVLTTTWVEIMNDPFLFALKLAPSRDVRVLGVFGVVSGAFVSRALTNRIHAAGALGVLVGLRLLQAVWWFLIPSPKAKAK
ncbi:hypothetical protein P7C73_g5788, partial [Tremellales sp. Uapishka_1]